MDYRDRRRDYRDRRGVTPYFENTPSRPHHSVPGHDDLMRTRTRKIAKDLVGYFGATVCYSTTLAGLIMLDPIVTFSGVASGITTTATLRNYMYPDEITLEIDRE